MEPEREHAELGAAQQRELDAEVRGLIEDLQRSRDAERRAPSLPSTQTQRMEDAVNPPEPEPGSAYIFSPPLPDPPRGGAPLAEHVEDYELAPRLEARAPSGGPAKSRARRFAESIGLAPSDASRRAAFMEKPLPAPDATVEQREAYLRSARKAGLEIERPDLDAFLDDLGMGGKLAVLGQHVSLPLGGGQGELAKIVAKQNPELVRVAAFQARAAWDAREAVRPGAFDDLGYDAVFGDATRFDRAMAEAGKLKPLTEKATIGEFETTRKAFRDIGVRLTVDDFDAYKGAVAKSGLAALKSAGGDRELPLAARMLVDLNRKPADRELLGASNERWSATVSRDQTLPVHEQQWSRIPASARNDAPRTVAPARENPYQPIPSEFRVHEPVRPENPYGVAISAHDVETAQAPPRSQHTMIRDGVERAMPPGYRQDGKFVAIDEQSHTVVQATRAVDGVTGRALETVRYDVADVEQSMPLEHVRAAIEDGHTMSVQLQDGRVKVDDLTLDRELERHLPTLEGPSH